MSQIETTRGLLDEALLERTCQFTDRPTEFTVTVEWYYRGELVRRDAHIILKRVPEAVEGVVAALSAR